MNQTGASSTGSIGLDINRRCHFLLGGFTLLLAANLLELDAGALRVVLVGRDARHPDVHDRAAGRFVNHAADLRLVPDHLHRHVEVARDRIGSDCVSRNRFRELSIACCSNGSVVIPPTSVKRGSDQPERVTALPSFRTLASSFLVPLGCHTTRQ